MRSGARLASHSLPGRDEQRRGARCPGLFAALLAALCFIGWTVSASAGDLRQPVLVFAVPGDIGAAQTPLEATPRAAVFTDLDALPYTVLAAQRGAGASVPMPTAPTPQSMPAIILWDELKSQSQRSITAADGQTSNQITIQGR